MPWKVVYSELEKATKQEANRVEEKENLDLQTFVLKVEAVFEVVRTSK